MMGDFHEIFESPVYCVDLSSSYLTSIFQSPLSIYHSVQDVEVAEEEADSSEAGRQHLLLQGESQQPQLQPVRLLNNKLLLPCRHNPPLHNKAGECSLELVLPLLRVWHSERDLQLPTVQLALSPIHSVEMKRLQLSSNNNNHSSMPLILSNNNLLGHVQMIRSCSLTA